MKNKIKKMTSVLLIVLLIGINSNIVLADDSKMEVKGSVFTFDDDTDYDIKEKLDENITTIENTYGKFSISGDISNVKTKNGVSVFEIEEGGNPEFFYTYSDKLLQANEDAWHLINDNSSEVNDIKLEAEVDKGVLIVQMSNDRKNWTTVMQESDAFNKVPVRTESIYSSTEVELINGCYYRVIVAYELAKRTDEKSILWINLDEYDKKECLEIYEFYVCSVNSTTIAEDINETYRLGSKVLCADYDTYYDEKEITKGDIHYGWDLGEFFVSGYTDARENNKGEKVFLKNVGDKVTLWFRLKQDINKLNGDDSLSISSDDEGSDQYFETPVMKFGKGCLIIRYTDHKNKQAEPIIYTDYLKANASLNADTKVQLFEEGDYEVALDYEVKSDEFINQYRHYRIFFKFSVRNGNCMVFPFDVETGEELINSSLTENGFRLDLAKSVYLQVNVKKEILTEGADGLVEDTRANGPAKDGAEYISEGIYTISVKNQYTGQTTEKKIYVGTNSVLKAHMVSGFSVQEINEMVNEGATIDDNGIIQLAIKEEQKEDEYITEQSQNNDIDKNQDDENQKENDEINYIGFMIPLIAAGIAISVSISISLKKKRTIK